MIKKLFLFVLLLPIANLESHEFNPAHLIINQNNNEGTYDATWMYPVKNVGKKAEVIFPDVCISEVSDPYVQGKYIAPQVLESLIKQSSFVEQIAVIGENQKMPSAIIQPNFEFCLQWLKEKGISCENNLEKICKQEELLNQFEEEIDFYNKSFAQ